MNSVNAVRQLESQLHPDAIPGFRMLVAEGRIGEPVLLNPQAKARLVRPIEWMLQRAQGDGIRLTAAGYLPPAVVRAAMEELGWLDGWIGKANREDLTPQIWQLHRATQSMKLLRVRKGVLLLTPLGREVVGSPDALWDRLGRSLLDQPSTVESMAVRFLLLCIATRSFETRNQYLHTVAFGLHTIGWVEPDHRQISQSRAFDLVAEPWRLLRLLGAFDTASRRGYDWGSGTAAGAALARHALTLESDPRH